MSTGELKPCHINRTLSYTHDTTPMISRSSMPIGLQSSSRGGGMLKVRDAASITEILEA